MTSGELLLCRAVVAHAVRAAAGKAAYDGLAPTSELPEFRARERAAARAWVGTPSFDLFTAAAEVDPDAVARRIREVST